MNAWAVRGVELPFGDEPVPWWIDGRCAPAEPAIF
jgi:hypothetical protein